ncbi:hypothetical protein JYT44_00320 [Caldithrix abyssi]|nr:hypothetical protein [Caldithrix abyssi]
MRKKIITGTILIIGLIAVWAAGSNPSSSEEVKGGSQVASAEPLLTDLDHLDSLRTLFQRDTGKVRLVALLSPT